MRSLILVLVVSALSLACSGPKKTGWVRFPEARPSDMEALKTETLPNGLVIETLRQGEGPTLGKGDYVYLHFSGWLQNDSMTKFDSSLDRGDYLQYLYGVHSINPGWDRGIKGMRVGGKRRLRVPAQLGYGKTGAGPVPPDSDLIYEIDLLKIKRP